MILGQIETKGKDKKFVQPDGLVWSSIELNSGEKKYSVLAKQVVSNQIYQMQETNIPQRLGKIQFHRWSRPKELRYFVMT